MGRMGSKIDKKLGCGEFVIGAPTHPRLPSIFKGAPHPPLPTLEVVETF
jgi:hypothetical protein